jgi:hypothetical protein
MGRHYGFIEMPTVIDSRLILAEKIPGRGAKPYDGPPRPKGF